jgi:hypothetical protein
VTDADLCREWRATATPSARARDELVELGVPPRDVELLIGIGQVRLYRSDFYEPDPDGRACLITPVCVHTALDPESSAPEVFCRAGAIVDLVAWHPEQPDRWALRAGAAEWLGCIEPQYLDEPARVPIRRSVLSWFQAGCTGLVLLSRSRLDQYRILMNCRGGIIAEDAAHRAELRRTLQRPFSTPRIWTEAKNLVRRGAPENAAPTAMRENVIADPDYRGDVAA